MKASAFRRWPVAGAYSPEQTTRLTGGSDSQQVAQAKPETSCLILYYIESDLSKYPHRNRSIEIFPSKSVYRNILIGTLYCEMGGTKAWGKPMLFPRKER